MSKKTIVQCFMILFMGVLYLPKAFSQDLNQDMQYLTNRIIQYNNISILAQVEIYNGENKLEQSQSYRLKKSGDSFIFSTEKLEMLFNSEVMLSVDREGKRILVSKRNAEKEKTTKIPSWDLGLDSLLQKIDPFIVYKHGTQGHVYILKPKSGNGIKEVSITLGEDKKSLKEVVYSFTPDGVYEYSRIVIKYASFDTQTIPAKDFFTNQFIVRKNGLYSPTKKYADYDISMF